MRRVFYKQLFSPLLSLLFIIIMILTLLSVHLLCYTLCNCNIIDFDTCNKRMSKLWLSINYHHYYSFSFVSKCIELVPQYLHDQNNPSDLINKLTISCRNEISK